MAVRRYMRGLSLTLIIAGCALILGACGNGQRQLSSISINLPAGGDTRAEQPAAPLSQEKLDDALAKLEAAQCPEGVDAKVWKELKNALGKALESRSRSGGLQVGTQTKVSRPGGRDSVRQTSSPPTTDGSKVADLAFGDDGTGNLKITWHYRNAGDCDQNGVVNIADITPIAMYYGLSYPPADVNSALAVIDGSGNGIVDIADLTPLAMNFGGECAEYALENASGAAGPFTEVSRVPLPEAGSGGRIALSAVQAFNPALPFVRVVPYDSAGAAGIASDVLKIEGAAPNITGIYSLVAIAGSEQQFVPYATGDAPLYYSWDFGGGAEPNTSSEKMPTVTIGAPGAYSAKLVVRNIFGSDEAPFTLTVSLPPEITGITPVVGDSSAETTFAASIAGEGPFTYAWDFGGGATPNTSADASPTVTLAQTGDYTVSLTVTSFFGTDTFQSGLHIMSWYTEKVETGSTEARMASLALDANGLPQVAYAYRAGLSYNLKYAYYDGAAWHIETVDGGTVTGLSPSLAIDSLGRPHISYYSSLVSSVSTRDLMYTYFDGSSWQTVTVDSDGDAGASSSLALNALDLPRIAYSSVTLSGVKHLKYAWNDGAAWNLETADGANNVGESCSLALDSLERPHVFYIDESGAYYKLKYAYYDGAAWLVDVVENELGAFYDDVTLKLDSFDLPHVSEYYSQGAATDDIEYRYFDGIDWRREVLGYTDRVASPSLALTSLDRPTIAFFDKDASALLRTWWNGAKWLTQTIDATGGEGPSMAMNAQDSPRVCYFNAGYLYYASYY